VRCVQPYGYVKGGEYVVSCVDRHFVGVGGEKEAGHDEARFQLVDAADELTQLRTFKAMALEKYPDLEPKPETDEEAFVATYDYWEAVDVGRVSFAERLELERNQLRIKNEKLIDAKIKAENAECLMELKASMMEQNLETIREIITNDGTAADVLKFIDTPPA